MIREVLKNLDPLTKEELKIAHDYSVPKYIKLPCNKFIGVHLNGVRHLTVEETYNDWYFGTINPPAPTPQE